VRSSSASELPQLIIGQTVFLRERQTFAPGKYVRTQPATIAYSVREF
jgi:hypothetical protein